MVRRSSCACNYIYIHSTDVLVTGTSDLKRSFISVQCFELIHASHLMQGLLVSFFCGVGKQFHGCLNKSKAIKL